MTADQKQTAKFIPVTISIIQALGLQTEDPNGSGYVSTDKRREINRLISTAHEQARISEN